MMTIQLPEIENYMDTPSARIQALMLEENINRTELAESIGKSKGLISGYLNSQEEPSDSFLFSIQNKLGWSAKWILTGTGPKRVTLHQPIIGEVDNKKNEAVLINFIDETDVTTSASGMEFRELDNGMVLMTIPLVDEFAYASYPHGWKDREYLIELPRYSIVLPKREKGIFRAFEVRGDSMDDGSRFSIGYGDVAVGRKIESDYWDVKLYTNGGTDYIIVTHDGVVIKRITKHNTKEGIITCSSINPDKVEYPDYEIRLTEVYELYKIRKVDRDWSRR
ncbi:XRE family transcriptional regulator [Spirosoma endbachense]|uniref:Helix-turn-helix domain-containing protein n=1 Tax=Spirosoma endbachense TaxID=2666025 RepID=A0A6P1VW68_9BACT|nr:helix-turn-helix domain-containing protein [Spirosoma endbachense]QHV96332.1 helix-turn-helix domain-containing protein [Spirosoma endbachense]